MPEKGISYIIESFSRLARSTKDLLELVEDFKSKREGIALAKAKGKYKGRKKIDFPDNWEGIYNKYRTREITVTNAMDLLGLKRNTFYKLKKEWEKN